ncbi:MAG: hypothetical protein H0U78_03940 [Rickettsiaceae bacterium]|jgi:hypothetical protein|nr:hypothetical protein [Rickettsiaceae bacterium]
MSKERKSSEKSDKAFLSKPLVDRAIGSYKGEIFQYIAKENCIVTSSKGAMLYREDLASDVRIIVATYKYFVFVKASLLPDIIDCFPDQPEAWVKELVGGLALEQ